MSEKTNLTIRIDEKLKADFEKLCDELGVNATSAIMIFIKKAVRDQAIPFKLDLTQDDGGKFLRNIIRQINATLDFSPESEAAWEKECEEHERKLEARLRAMGAPEEDLPSNINFRRSDKTE